MEPTAINTTNGDNAFFGDALRKMRREAGLTLKQTAGTIGVSVPHMSDIERGRKNPPTPDRIRELAEAFGKGSEVETLLVAAMKTRDNTISIKTEDEKAQRVLACLQCRIDNTTLIERLERILDQYR